MKHKHGARRQRSSHYPEGTPQHVKNARRSDLERRYGPKSKVRNLSLFQFLVDRPDLEKPLPSGNREK